ncbi:MAG: hypothetical protein P8M34_01670 [Saprospiraceae bacterium]|nr:hypothetical protein [Saprospiraceae bacterium]
MFDLFKKKRPDINLSEDIIKRIEKDFGKHKGKAIHLITEQLFQYKHLNSDRIIRCIVFLSRKNLDGLKTALYNAVVDWRDVIAWAEYAPLNVANPVKVRDFNKPFGEEELN